MTLLNDAGNTPGSPIATLETMQDSTLTNSPMTVVITPATSITLNAGTRYWIELVTNAAVFWQAAGNDNGTGVSGEYSQLPNDSPGPNSVGTPFEMQVTASDISAVPLPPACEAGFAAIGLLFAGHLSRQRRNARTAV